MAKKPQFIDKQELKRRLRDGIERRRKDGTLIELDKQARPDPRGAHFSKKQRKRYVQLSELAIYELAHRNFRDWYHAIYELSTLMLEAGFSRPVLAHTMRTIEEMAEDASDDMTLRLGARRFLYEMNTRVISVPGQSPGHSQVEAAINDSVHPPEPEPTKRNASRRTRD